MPRLPAIPDSDPFFARPEGGRNECPRCGYLDQWYTPGPVRGEKGSPHRWMVKRQRADAKRKGRAHLTGWNPLTSRWTCPSCEATFVVGLLFWPIEKAGKGVKYTIPRDQVPDYRQLAQLRAQQAAGGGLWMREPVKAFRPEGTNICPGCSCRKGKHGTPEGDPGCPWNVAEGEDGENSQNP